MVGRRIYAIERAFPKNSRRWIRNFALRIRRMPPSADSHQLEDCKGLLGGNKACNLKVSNLDVKLGKPVNFSEEIRLIGAEFYLTQEFTTQVTLIRQNDGSFKLSETLGELLKEKPPIEGFTAYKNRKGPEVHVNQFNFAAGDEAGVAITAAQIQFNIDDNQPSTTQLGLTVQDAADGLLFHAELNPNLQAIGTR